MKLKQDYIQLFDAKGHGNIGDTYLAWMVSVASSKALMVPTKRYRHNEVLLCSWVAKALYAAESLCCCNYQLKSFENFINT